MRFIEFLRVAEMKLRETKLYPVLWDAIGQFDGVRTSSLQGKMLRLHLLFTIAAAG